MVKITQNYYFLIMKVHVELYGCPQKSHIKLVGLGRLKWTVFSLLKLFFVVIAMYISCWAVVQQIEVPNAVDDVFLRTPLYILLFYLTLSFDLKS